MKKSVVILIAIIYVASIALVTFFGLKHNSFFEDVLVTNIEITNKGISYDENNLKYVVVPKGQQTYKIEYKVSPDNAVNKAVTFVTDKDNPFATVDENGLVTFKTATTMGAVTVYVYAADGSGKYDVIEIAKLG